MLYSYSTPIAAFAKDADRADRVLLLNSRKYSTTTNKQMCQLRYALRGLNYTQFEVPRVQTYASYHEVNCAKLVDDYVAFAAKEKRRVKWYGYELEPSFSILGELRERVEIAQRYARIFKLTIPEFPLTVDTTAIDTRRERLLRSPEALARRAAAEARDAARNAARDIERAKQDAITRAENAATIAAWLRGERVQLPWGCRQDADGSAMLRIEQRGEECTLQTSLGAEVSLQDARYMVSWMRSDKTPRVLVNGPHVGPFQLNAFLDNGVRIGCHFITWTEIDRVFPLPSALNAQDQTVQS